MMIIIEQRKEQGGYSLEDVSKAINYILKSKFMNVSHDNIVTKELEQNQKIYKDKKSNLFNNNKGLSDEQERFLAFLQANPSHNLSTVELYKQVDLSARKGTKIKNQLIEKGLININEERNKKGWKKIIMLAWKLKTDKNINNLLKV